MKNRLIQLSIGLGVSVALVVLVLRMIDMSALTAALSVADVRLIPVAIAVYLLAMLVRSVLWHRLLPVPTPIRTLFQVEIVGFAVNYVMPVRVGEIARAYLLSRWRGLAYGTTIASMVAERVLDGLSVSVILLGSMLFIQAPEYVSVIAVTVGTAFGGLSIALLVTSWKASGVIALSGVFGRFLPVGIRYRFERLVHGFATGLEPLRNWRALPGLLALSLLGWLLQFTVFFLLMLAFPFRPSFPLATLAGSVSNFATLLPSAPGYVGAFDATLVKLLMDIQGVNLEHAAAYALLVHTVLVVPIVILGAFMLWRADMSLGQVMRRSVERKAPASSGAVAINAN